MDPADLPPLIQQAMEALEAGDHVRALAIADQLAATAPGDPNVCRLRARALLAGGGDPDEALAEAHRAAELEPQNAMGQHLLGMAAWKAQRLTLAQQSLQWAVDLSGQKPDLLADYAWFMASERGPRLAEEAACKAIDADAHSPTAWAALGLAQFRLHRRRQAEVSLRRALALDPKGIHAQSAMVLLLHEQRKDPQAETLAELLEKGPETEPLVESVRQEAKKRQIAKMLVERAALPEPPSADSPRRRAMWIVVVAVLVAGLCLLIQPDDPRAWALCVAFPLVVLWLLRRFLV